MFFHLENTPLKIHPNTNANARNIIDIFIEFCSSFILTLPPSTTDYTIYVAKFFRKSSATVALKHFVRRKATFVPNFFSYL